jgi:hypothetical protein
MSSHHFVKEGQEPALLIVDPISFDLVQPLLEWAPLVIVLESALENTLKWGIKADIVISTTQSIAATQAMMDHQAPVKIVSCLTSDETFQTAMDFLLAENHKAVNVCVDQHDNYFEKTDSYADKLDITLIDPVYKWSAIPTGIFRKWLPAGAVMLIRSSGSFSVDGDGFIQSGNRIQTTGNTLITINSAAFFWVGESLE